MSVRLGVATFDAVGGPAALQKVPDCLSLLSLSFVHDREKLRPSESYGGYS